MKPYLLHQAFLRAAARYSGRPALRCTTAAGRTVWTYAELERASRAAAVQLLAEGLQPGDRVGVWMRKSPETVAALLAALRAGGVYVPLDPAAPPARIARLAADCGLRHLFADPGLRAEAGGFSPSPRLLPLPSAGPDAAPLPPDAAIGDDLAYILYTSGSTGVPKGVMLTHAHALNFIGWAAACAGLSARDRVASHAPFHFDLSIFDLWATLSRGAEVLLLDSVTSRFPRAAADWILAEKPTVWYSVPSALVQLLPYAGEIGAAAAGGEIWRALLFAGEVFPAAALAAWRRRLPRAAFHNWYGPTETNVCTAFALPPGEPVPDPLPIGRPCPNFTCAVRHDDGSPAAPGASGALWVRGTGVFAGYWNDAARTAAVTELGEAPGGRMQRWYNTGDRVRKTSGDWLIYEGRNDDLIKCRGYRISLLEIAHALESCPGVAQAAVIAVGANGVGLDSSAGTEPAVALRAYVRPAGAHPPGPVEIRGHLGRLLPAYMMPERIEVQAELPLTSSGKLDRRGLALDANREPPAGAASVARQP